jgi:hypothetical protein
MSTVPSGATTSKVKVVTPGRTLTSNVVFQSTFHAVLQGVLSLRFRGLRESLGVRFLLAISVLWVEAVGSVNFKCGPL